MGTPAEGEDAASYSQRAAFNLRTGRFSQDRGMYNRSDIQVIGSGLLIDSLSSLRYTFLTLLLSQMSAYFDVFAWSEGALSHNILILIDFS